MGDCIILPWRRPNLNRERMSVKKPLTCFHMLSITMPIRPANWKMELESAVTSKPLPDLARERFSRAGNVAGTGRDWC